MIVNFLGNCQHPWESSKSCGPLEALQDCELYTAFIVIAVQVDQEICSTSMGGEVGAIQKSITKKFPIKGNLTAPIP